MNLTDKILFEGLVPEEVDVEQFERILRLHNVRYRYTYKTLDELKPIRDDFTDEFVEEIKSKINNPKYVQELIVDKDNFILDGNGRALAIFEKFGEHAVVPVLQLLDIDRNDWEFVSYLMNKSVGKIEPLREPAFQEYAEEE